MADEPVRLRDDPSIDARLREDLARASEAAPAIDVSAGLARLSESIGAAGGGAGGAGAGWIAGALAALVLGGAGAWVWLARGHEQAERPAGVAHGAASSDVAPEPASSAEPSAPPPGPASSEEPGAPPPEPAVENVEDPRADPSPPSARVARRRTATPSARSAEAGPEATGEDEALREEMRLLAQARSALGADPARALSLANEGRRRFPAGLFGEELEAIAVLATSALGRGEQARRRGESFLRAHPRGPFSERVRSAIEAP